MAIWPARLPPLKIGKFRSRGLGLGVRYSVAVPILKTGYIFHDRTTIPNLPCTTGTGYWVIVLVSTVHINIFTKCMPI